MKTIFDIPTMWTEIRYFMDAQGGNLPQNSSRRLIMSLSNGLYEEYEDRDAAVNIAQLVLANAHPVTSDLGTFKTPASRASSQTQYQGSGQYYANRKVHDVGRRLKDSDKNFSG